MARHQVTSKRRAQIRWLFNKVIKSKGYFSAECRCVSLGQELFMKIRNVVHFADTWILTNGQLVGAFDQVPDIHFSECRNPLV